MAIKYHPSDDGTVVEGKTVVFLDGGNASPEEETAPAKVSAAARERNREQDAAAQAAALIVAAKDGIPFCEQCEKARLAREKAAAGA
jgi:hypothetical protein